MKKNSYWILLLIIALLVPSLACAERPYSKLTELSSPTGSYYVMLMNASEDRKTSLDDIATWLAYAPNNIPFVTTTASSDLSAEVSLGLLTDGVLYITVSGGIATISSKAIGTGSGEVAAGDHDHSSITGTAAGLTNQYIDWDSESGGSSIANKPTIPSGDLVDDTTPQLGGDLDLDGNKLVQSGASDFEIESPQDVSNKLGDDGGTYVWAVRNSSDDIVAYIDSLGNVYGLSFNSTTPDGGRFVSANNTSEITETPTAGRLGYVASDDKWYLADGVDWDNAILSAESPLSDFPIALRTKVITVGVGNGSDAISTGINWTRAYTVPGKCDLTKIEITTNEVSGSITLDFWVDEPGAADGLAAITDADSLFDTATEPAIADASSDNTPPATTTFDTGEAVDIPAGSRIVPNVDAAATLTYVQVTYTFVLKD